MRHKRATTRLGRDKSHRAALAAALVGSLIEHKRIVTTLAKAKMAGAIAEQLVTRGKKDGGLADKRQIIARLRHPAVVHKLYAEVIPALGDRNSGYTRIVKMGRRRSDGSEMAILEWVGIAPINRKKKVKKKDEKKDEKTEAAKK